MSYPQLTLYIGGAWAAGELPGTMDVRNPATDELLGSLPQASPAQLDAAVAAASAGFQTWSRMTPSARLPIIARATALLRERAGHIAAVMTAEQGKPLAEAQREVLLSAEFIDFLANEALRLYGRTVPARTAGILLQQIEHVPVGPTAAFSPWNFPMDLPARKLGACVAAGCSMVLKPAEQTPGTAIELVRAFHDAGLPAGVVNLVTGQPGPISAHLIAAEAIRKVSFTGSVPVGKQLGALALAGMKRYTAELGGHAPVVVCADTDLDATVRACVTGKYRNAGQICVSPTRFIVHRSIFARFAEAFAAAAQALKVGPGNQEGVQMGPLAHAGRVAAMEALVADAVACGGRLLTGGTRLPGPGHFFAPTVLADVPHSARAMRDEPFGPLAMLSSFETLDEAIAEANRLPYGLAAYAFSRDLATAHALGARIEAGMVGINHFAISQPELPFGGLKDSGIGSEKGAEGLLAYTDTKLISFGA
jgi:succinate-semialdehyde dehydrogenase / glutarate-semialdehyde dehydrogenase